MKNSYPNKMTPEEYNLAKLHWCDAYVLMPPYDGYDPHQSFADMIGTTRQRAKEISYMFTWRHDCHHFRLVRDQSRMVRCLVDMVNEGREERQSVHKIMSEAEERVDRHKKTRGGSS